MLRLIALSTLLLSQFCWSKDSIKLFVQHELNDTDTISSLGVSHSLLDTHSKVRGDLLASVGYAQIEDKDDIIQHFLTSDFGVRLGYYDKMFVYVEGGIDLLEILFRDFRDDPDYYYYDQSDNTPDGYAAVGAGIDSGKLKIEGFVKVRNIDSDNWDSKHHVFYGLQLSLSF